MATLLSKLAMGLYGATATVLTPIIKRHLSNRRERGKEHPKRYKERFGFTETKRPTGRLIWIHAASVGESISILPLIEAINSQDHGFLFLITTGTTTSAKLMEKRLPENAVHQFIPVDTPAATERFLSYWKPDLGLIVESELWPQLIFRANKHKIPLVLINARMSKKSTASWKRVSFFIRDLLNNFNLILAQSRQDADHFEELGAKNVIESSNLKFSAAPLTYHQKDLENLRDLIGDRPVWFASSTHKGEELFLSLIQKRLQDQHPDLLCIIAPRHPERGLDIAKELRTQGFDVAVRSASETISTNTNIYLADTLGELGLFYEISPVVVMGGSLLRKGGQNLLEPARQNCAIICGPEMQNFEAICNEMLRANAVIKLESPDQLADKIRELLESPSDCKLLATTAEQYTSSKGKEIEIIAKQVLYELHP